MKIIFIFCVLYLTTLCCGVDVPQFPDCPADDIYCQKVRESYANAYSQHIGSFFVTSSYISVIDLLHAVVVLVTTSFLLVLACVCSLKIYKFVPKAITQLAAEYNSLKGFCSAEYSSAKVFLFTELSLFKTSFVQFKENLIMKFTISMFVIPVIGFLIPFLMNVLRNSNVVHLHTQARSARKPNMLLTKIALLTLVIVCSISGKGVKAAKEVYTYFKDLLDLDDTLDDFNESHLNEGVFWKNKEDETMFNKFVNRVKAPFIRRRQPKEYTDKPQTTNDFVKADADLNQKGCVYPDTEKDDQCAAGVGLRDTTIRCQNCHKVIATDPTARSLDRSEVCNCFEQLCAKYNVKCEPSIRADNFTCPKCKFVIFHCKCSKNQQDKDILLSRMCSNCERLDDDCECVKESNVYKTPTILFQKATVEVDMTPEMYFCQNSHASDAPFQTDKHICKKCGLVSKECRCYFDFCKVCHDKNYRCICARSYCQNCSMKFYFCSCEFNVHQNPPRCLNCGFASSTCVCAYPEYVPRKYGEEICPKCLISFFDCDCLSYPSGMFCTECHFLKSMCVCQDTHIPLSKSQRKNRNKKRNRQERLINMKTETGDAT